MTEKPRTLDELIAYVLDRMIAVDIIGPDLDRCDMHSPAFDIAFRHGMATAFHEVLHRLWEMVDNETK